jgi:LCP family protein required for cell wall assembly
VSIIDRPTRPPAQEPPPARHRRHGFGWVAGWTVLTALLPGAGLLAAGRRRAGRVIVSVTGLLAIGAVVVLVVVGPLALGRRLLADPDRFLQVVAGLAVLALAWLVVLVAAHLALRRDADLSSPQRVLGWLLVASLIAAVLVPTVAVGRDAVAARDALTSVFDRPGSRLGRGNGPAAAKTDPWSDVPRVNVLLLGGDSGPDRTGVRPDTLILASVDTRSGDTVLISLPRNLQRVPFPPDSRAAADHPDGFTCYNAAAGANTECLLNALWAWGDAHPEYYPGDPHPGLTATVQGVEQATGLPVDDYVMLNLAGFQQLVDILGGLTLTVTERLPVGGNVEHPVASSWLEPGRQTLNGYLALWYARSRWSTTDYDRMRRQRCVIGALVDQADPVTLALRFPEVAATLKQNLQTSISLDEIDAWVSLAERVKKAHVRSLAFTDQVINTARPDFPAMHALVQAALTDPSGSAGAASSRTSSGASGATSSATPSASGAASGSPAGSPAGSPSSAATAGGPTPTSAQDVTQVC